MDRPNDRSLRQDLAGLLRELRESRGMKQSDLATALGVHQSFVSKYEAAERKLDLVEVRAICNAVGTSFPEFTQRVEARWSVGE